MNTIQSLIDRQLGISCSFNYDRILKRLIVDSDESFYGLQSSGAVANFEQDPPIFACRFAEAAGCEHILALANEDGRVAIQDTSSPRTASQLESFQCHDNAVFDLAWMPGHMTFVTVSGDHTARLWDSGEGAPRQLVVFSAHSRSVKCAAFPPRAPALFASGARDGHVLLWDVRRPATSPALVLKPDNRLAGCHSAAAPASHGKRARLDRRAISITGLAFQDERTLLSCGECDGNVKVWDLRKNYDAYRREPLPKHSIPYCGSSAKNGYTNLLIDDRRMRLYASCMDDVVYCFNVATYGATPERRYVGHENATFYVKTGLSPDGAYLVSGSSDGHAYVWNVECSEPVVKLVGHRAEVTCAAWCPRGDTKLVTCSDDARHKIWRIGRELHESGEHGGRAESVPRTDRTQLPKWGALDKTPSSLKRKAATPDSYGAKRPRPQAPARKTKRCLMDLMNAARDADETETMVKRMKLDDLTTTEEERLLPAGVKRHHGTEQCGDYIFCSPKAGTSVTSNENYDPSSCKASSKGSKTPEYASPETPPKVRIIAFRTPTKDLPDFVMSGEAPHLRLMSPAKKKRETTDWLTLMVREKRGKTDNNTGEKPPEPAPASPKQAPPPRRVSVSEKTPKASKNTRTLLKYFSVSTKGK